MAVQSGILLKSGTNELEIIEFYIDELDEGRLYRGSYGINVAKIVEIIQQPKTVPVPMAPREILGTFVFRGKVIPLVDLAAWLGKTKPEGQANPIALVAQVYGIMMAFAVSGINRIHRLSWGQIEPAGAFLGAFSDSITGIVKVGEVNALILDMEKIVAELNPQAQTQENVATLETGFKYKALVVDDSPSLVRFLSDILTKAGFEVETAINGADGMRRLKAAADRAQRARRPLSDFIHIVISDIEMPEMDGYSFCLAIKSDPMLESIPVILFSSLITDSQRHKGMAVGADDQISKPQAAHLAIRAKELIEKSITAIKH